MNGTILPTWVGGAASAWSLVDWQLPAWQSDPAAGGVATLRGDQLANDELWLIDRAIIDCSSVFVTSLRLYEDAPDPSRLLDGSDRGNFDVAEYPSGLVVRPSSVLVAQWTGASDGAVGTLRLQVRQMRRR